MTITISDNKLDFLAGTEYAADVYMLVWSNPVIMKAQVNQASFDVTITEITFDQTLLSFSKGSYTSAIEGYIVYLSRTTDMREYYVSLRLRADSSTTQLFVEMNSADIQDDDYIFVVKDVQFRKRQALPGFIDVDIPFQAPPPMISGIDTAYLLQTDINTSVINLIITPSAIPIASGATIATWALTLDGGTQIAFNASTGATTIQYDTPGEYMPRWKVTDSNGNSQWFSPHITVVDENLTNIVNLNVLGANISHSVDGGSNASIPFFAGIEKILDGTFIAIAIVGTKNVGGSNIVYTGQIRFENNDHTIDRESSSVNTVSFDLQGIIQQMSSLKNPGWIYQNKAAPSNYNELKDATLWRVVSTYLWSMTTFNNTYGLSSDDVSDDYQLSEFVIEKSNYFDALMAKMQQINGMFNCSNSGPMTMARNAFYINPADRNALPVVANWQKQHYSTKGDGGNLWSLEHSHALRLSQITGGGAWYDTTAKNINLLLGYAPAVIAAGGQEQTELNGQILIADQTDTQAKAELNQRVTDAFSAMQELDTFSPEVPDIFTPLLSPSVSAWHTHTMERSDNLRGYEFTNRRSLLMSVGININVESGRPMITPRFQFEPTRLQYQALLANPPDAAGYVRPVLPLQPSMLNFPETPGLSLPTGALPGVDDQPVSPSDMDKTTQPKDPLAVSIANTAISGNLVLAWSEGTLHYADNLGLSTSLAWRDTGYTVAGGHILTQAAWDRFSDSRQAAYAISHNDTITDAETIVRTNASIVNKSGWSLPISLENNILATLINVTGNDAAIIYGKFEQFIAASWTIHQLDGDGTEYLAPSLLVANHAAPVRTAAGIYNLAGDYYLAAQADAGAGYGQVVNIQFDIPPGAEITYLSFDIWCFRTGSSAANGERQSTVEVDGVVEEIFTYAPTIGGPFGQRKTYTGVSWTGSTLMIHVSYNRDTSTGTWVRITDVEIRGSSVADHVGTRYCENFGVTWEGARDVGLMDLGEGSMVRRYGQAVLAAKNEQVRKAALAGLAYGSDADQGDTTSQYAKALWKFDTGDDYLLAPDGGSVGLYKIINNVRTDISPNDGSVGFVVGPGGLAMVNNNDQFIAFLGSFGGTTKLAYTNDQGENWNYNTDVTNDALWVHANAVSESPNIQLAVADGSVLKYSVDGAVTFIDLAGPATNLTGVEIL